MVCSTASIYSLEGFLLHVVNSNDSRVNIIRIFNISFNSDDLRKPVRLCFVLLSYWFLWLWPLQPLIISVLLFTLNQEQSGDPNWISRYNTKLKHELSLPVQLDPRYYFITDDLCRCKLHSHLLIILHLLWVMCTILLQLLAFLVSELIERELF